MNVTHPAGNGDDDKRIAADYGDALIAVAAEAIRHGLDAQKPGEIRAATFPAPLRALRATFVTLTLDGVLRGCIGSMTAHQPLVEDVAFNAYGAAFRDPRFAPATWEAWPHLAASISILGTFTSLPCATERELLAQLRVGVDGLAIAAEGRRGVFLPQVWETLPEPISFFRALREKAGLPKDYWSVHLRIERFEVTHVTAQRLSDCSH